MTIKRTILILTLIVSSIILAACNANTAASTGDVAQVPAGKAYAEGKEIFFSHTEASDPAIAEKLTNMMNSPVLHVPALADVPASSLADVYVFENGVAGKGPLGFQPDVFDSPPGSDGYSPLRQIILVNWVEGASARLLTAEAEIAQAEADGQLTTQPTGVVVNMPFMVWDGGKR
jgi:predicted small secreted protein